MYNKIDFDNNYIIIDNIYLNSVFEEIHGSNNFFEWLVPSVFVENSAQKRYIHELVNKKISCNFPVLVCGDDLDFSCEVVVIKTEWTENSVIWTKFGTVRKDPDFSEKYVNSGIRKIENWTESDWKKYNLIAYDLIYDENFFNEWRDNNYYEESYRRVLNYYHGYFNDDNNIDWIGEVNFRFAAEDYLKNFDKMYNLY